MVKIKSAVNRLEVLSEATSISASVGVPLRGATVADIDMRVHDPSAMGNNK